MTDNNALAQELEALSCAIMNNDPSESIADNGMTVWHGIRHTAAYLFPRLCAALREQKEISWIDILREWFGGERYARDYEYLDANYGAQAKRVADYLNTRTPAPASGEVETGWLIELPWTAAGGGRLCWVALKPGRFPLFKTLKHNEDYDFQKIESPLKFTPESNEALRFSRKVDAEAFIEKFDLYLMHAIATEHQWINATADILERLAGPVQGDGWERVGFLEEKLKQAETERDEWKERAMSERIARFTKPVQQVGGDQVERVAFAIIEGSSGIRAAEHAREFQTANWTDGLRSARAALAAMQPLDTKEG